jgi:NMD protein affecting ribosome stability and mRNA decay
MSSTGPKKPALDSANLDVTGARPMVQCPKCGTQVRDIARFCTRCHATLRFQCPSCTHEQLHGGTCEKCGVNFLKYIRAILAAKKAEADQFHDRLEQRSTLLKNMLWVPFTLGIPLIRSLLVSRDRDKS